MADSRPGFLRILADVRGGERIGVLYGRSKTPVAMIVPQEPAPAGRRELGFLDGEVTIEFTDGFKMTVGEFSSDA